jgi:hypothetical protein
MRCWLRVVVVVTIGISSSLGAEFTTKIVDALGRPLDGVEVHVTIPKMLAGSEKHEKERLDLRTNADGMVKGHYDEKLIPKDESVWVYVGKEGYESYSTSELRPEYAQEPGNS